MDSADHAGPRFAKLRSATKYAVLDRIAGWENKQSVWPANIGEMGMVPSMLRSWCDSYDE